jgi:hypothetical protein
MENEILLILKKLFTNDISNYIFNIYLINKYFSENLNNKSIQLYKNKFMNTNYSNIIINKINYNYLSLHFIKKLVIIDNTLTLRFLDKIPILIKYLDYSYKNNEEVFIKIIRKDNSLIKYASQELKGNREFIGKMIDVYPASIYYAKKELKDDYELALKAIKLDGDIIEYLSSRLRNNDEIIKISKENNYNYHF